MFWISGAWEESNDFVTNDEVRQITKQLPFTSIMKKRRFGLFGHAVRSGPTSDTRRVIAMPTPSQWKRPPGRPLNPWLSVVAKDIKDVSIPDTMIFYAMMMML